MKLLRSSTPTAQAQEGRDRLWQRYGEDAADLVKAYDFSEQDIAASRRLQQANAGPIDLRSATWFLPDFHNAYFGGIHTVLRFAEQMTLSHGTKNQFAVIGSLPPASVAAMIHDAFPSLAGASVRRLGAYSDLGRLEPTDVGAATLWTTAYYLLRFNAVRRKLYFVQDFEPLFYPAGSTYGQAEATYRFGFHALANTPTIEAIYESEYGGVAHAFVPAVDTTLFHPPPRGHPSGPPWTVFLYGRPDHPRNAFELASAATRILKKRLGRDVRIVSAGADWHPDAYGLEGIVQNLGLLAYGRTAELYRTCHAGLAMMFTRHPSYLPFELMASGTLVVSNRNAATAWMLRHDENALLADASATSIADELERGLTDVPLRNRLVDQALTEIQERYSDWAGEIGRAIDFVIRGA